MSHACNAKLKSDAAPDPQPRTVIAVAGKGGTGKTTISSIIARLLTEKGQSLLAVDADPPMGLTYAVGAEPQSTLGDMRRRIIEDPEQKRRVSGDTPVRDIIIEDALIQRERLDLLVVGQSEGPGCYCGLNELLKFGIESLASRYRVTLVDCEAGIEQINRRVISSISHLLMVSDPTVKGLRTAEYLLKISDQYGVEGQCRVGLVVNRVSGRIDGLAEKADRMGLGLWGTVPLDDNVARFDLNGAPTFDLPRDSSSVLAVEKILLDLGLI